MVKIEEKEDPPTTIKRENDWPAILLYLYIHIVSVIALVFIKDTYFSTLLFGVLLIFLGFLGTTAGAHRLWTHRTYTADVKLRIFLMLCQTLVGEGTIYTWVLQHRLHHKYFGTNLDPFNPNKGFLHAHVVSRTVKPAEGYDRLKAGIDMSDIESDSIVMFQKKYYWILYIIFTLLLPINAPAEYWGESLASAGLIIGILRLGISINLSWLVTSGIKVLSKQSVELSLKNQNLVELIEKEDWLPYHYIAPWDYQTSEYGGYGNDLTSAFIRACRCLGIASGLKTMDGLTVGKAIQISAETNKPISECLLEVHGFDVDNSKDSK